MVGFVNKRALDIWDIVTPHVNFRDKTVVDVGCGPGDFIRLALGYGAKHVTGIDMNFASLLDASNVLKDNGRAPDKEFTLHSVDINDLVNENNLVSRADILICFSCLPYLDNYVKATRWMARMSKECALIESQYSGDGPGPAFLKGDGDMRDTLTAVWSSVEKIGETDTVIRDASRSVWLCRSE